MKRLAIIGAGPIGLEAALRGAQKGFDVDVFERGPRIAHNMRRWGHVRFFSPWKLNRSPWGAAALRQAGVELEDDETFPTGDEYIDAYLKPLADLPDVAGALHFETEVVNVARAAAHKGDLVGSREEEEAGPFLLHVRRGDEEAYVEADYVLDTSGVYDVGSPLGPGGLPALGEAQLNGEIYRFIPDVQGDDRDTYAGKRVLVVGSGYSAVTSLKGLHELKQEVPSTQISWVFQGDQPYERVPNDSLPERDALAVFGNNAAAGKAEGITPLANVGIISTKPTGDEVEVTIDRDGTSQKFVVDRIIANTGYRPNLELARELQIHLCYASEGPMKLAASLMSASGGADCLNQESGGVDTLRSPESDYFIAGMKSYGRNSMFLLKVGYEQIEEILSEGFSEAAAAE